MSGDEYGIYYRPEVAAGRFRRARAMLIWRIGSLALSLGAIGAAWLLWPEQFGPWAPWLLTVSAISGGLYLTISSVQFVRVRRDAAAAQTQALAIGLNRDGLLAGQLWLPWPEVGSLVVRPGFWGGSSVLSVTSRDQRSGRVALDYTDTLPAALDSAVRALSAGRAWIDLSRLD